jgi:hypothetical protein
MDTYEADACPASKEKPMKKSALNVKLKLQVNRETLRVLETPQLVAAGADAEPSATVRYSNCGSCNTGIE